MLRRMSGISNKRLMWKGWDVVLARGATGEIIRLTRNGTTGHVELAESGCLEFKQHEIGVSEELTCAVRNNGWNLNNV